MESQLFSQVSKQVNHALNQEFPSEVEDVLRLLLVPAIFNRLHSILEMQRNTGVSGLLTKNKLAKQMGKLTAPEQMALTLLDVTERGFEIEAMIVRYLKTK